MNSPSRLGFHILGECNVHICCNLSQIENIWDMIILRRHHCFSGYSSFFTIFKLLGVNQHPYVEGNVEGNMDQLLLPPQCSEALVPGNPLILNPLSPEDSKTWLLTSLQKRPNIYLQTAHIFLCTFIPTLDFLEYSINISYWCIV